MKIGIIGCGNIGTELALYLDEFTEDNILYLCDIDKDKIKVLQQKLKNNKPEQASFETVMNLSDFVIESAHPDVVRKIFGNAFVDKKDKKILVMSTGGLISCLSVLEKIEHTEVFAPSGAVAGIDGLKTVAGHIDSLKLTTTKPAGSLASSPYVQKQGIEVGGLSGSEEIFSGTLEKAIEGFPQNINVAATIFLATKFKDMEVSVVADPAATTNKHEIVCSGDFGKLTLISENKPSRNPKTSFLAILSAQQVLKDISQHIHIGD